MLYQLEPKFDFKKFSHTAKEKKKIISLLNKALKHPSLLEEVKKEPSVSNKELSKLYIEEAFLGAILATNKKVSLIADRLLVYMIIATVIGARLGHLFFYESPSYYLKNPLVIFMTWKGGLASHGAVVGIFIAIFFD